ncbi:hypothetical protein AMTR_s00078p00168600 [Amborella trichopoda]|uniref:Uncharacterized protein n=1 Tax=Amborella trichopoda TaxID=13333 RepID=W1P205_AMBTC|nr:hypothetical protein AMTR_s00078p00168600 [Amborella trichopoda]
MRGERDRTASKTFRVDLHTKTICIYTHTKTQFAQKKERSKSKLYNKENRDTIRRERITWRERERRELDRPIPLGGVQSIDHLVPSLLSSVLALSVTLRPKKPIPAAFNTVIAQATHTTHVKGGGTLIHKHVEKATVGAIIDPRVAILREFLSTTASGFAECYVKRKSRKKRLMRGVFPARVAAKYVL